VFRLIWTGQLISMIGRQLTLVAVPYQVYQLTGSTLAVGLLGLVQAVPLVIAGLYSGSLADRFDRRRVMLGSQAVQAACSLLLFLGTTRGHPAVWFLYAVTAAAAPASTTEHAARSATTPRIVGPAKVASALSLNQVLFQFALVAGPSLAGVIIGIDLRWAYLLDVICYAAAMATVARIPALPPLPGAPPVLMGLRAPVEGLAFAWRERVLFGIFAADLAAMVFGMPRALFPALAAHVFHVGPGGLGLLYAAPGAGALVGSIFTGGISRVRAQGLSIIWAVTAWGLAITAFGFAGGVFPLALVLLGVAGAADMVSAIFRGTVLQLVAPDHLRGRVSALNSMVVTVGPRLGDVEAGAVAAATSLFFSVVSGGVLCVVAIALIAWRVPELRHRVQAPTPAP
jgi:MFS family permease